MATITIKDVAKLANVAPSTVSRVIANNNRISEATKKRVRKAMEELGYHPNFNARSLANKSTKAIGLVMPSSASKTFQNPFFPEVIRGISSYARIKDYTLYMTTGETEEEILNDCIKMVQGKRVDGLILLYSRNNDPIVEYLVQTKFPFVLIGKPFKYADEITYIDNDNYKAARELTEYLIGKSHKKIAFIGGNLNLLVTQDRLNGYKDAMKLATIPIHDEYIKHMEFDREGGQLAVSDLMSLPEKPTAIFVTDDMMALGVLSVLQERNVQVPDHVSVVSFNNIIVSELTSPPLTTVDVNIFQLGIEACKAVVECTENEQYVTKSIIIPTKIIERQSSK